MFCCGTRIIIFKSELCHNSSLICSLRLRQEHFVAAALDGLSPHKHMYTSSLAAVPQRREITVEMPPRLSNSRDLLIALFNKPCDHTINYYSQWTQSICAMQKIRHIIAHLGSQNVNKPLSGPSGGLFDALYCWLIDINQIKFYRLSGPLLCWSCSWLLW